MATPYFSIDTGLIHDPGKKLDCLITDFYEAEYGQSYIFYGSVSSLPWLLQQNQDDPTGAAREIRNQLEIYLGRYFDLVEVEVAPQESDSTTKYDLMLYIGVTDEGRKVTLYQQLKIAGTKLEQSIEIRK